MKRFAPLLLLVACSGAPARAPARAIVVSSAYAARMALEACQSAVDAEPSEQKALEIAGKCQAGLRAAQVAIKKAAVAVDSWGSAASENEYSCAAKDSLSALLDVAEALKSSGYKVPESLTDAIALLKPVAGVKCSR